ncbi:MAG TPA: phosphatidate cytidylyltransferase [Microbacterium sp.]|uniref:phosphatidate cytidylyltransferase n=1 Tax=Microbacterium sp. TaxID=51671 RepID=UPI002B49D360|nr:phosphatidate cytidylyltransferase [Microbacterium sp.]HKT57884.1 phosphatidate cytidylyltransferase [Microbacterium sp.]
MSGVEGGEEPDRVERDQADPSHPDDAASALQAHLRSARADFEEANERIKERTGRDLIVAILIALAIGAVVVASLVFLKQLFVLFALAAVGLAVWEFSRALQGAGHRIDIIPQTVCAAALVLTGWFYGGRWIWWIALFGAVVLVLAWRFIGQMIARDGRTYGAVLDDVMLASFIQLYVALTGSLCVVLLDQDHGEWWVLSFLIVAVAADTGAYASGLMFGRHPMAPRISPKKTWEGFAGAVVASVAAGVLLALFLLGVPWWAGVIFGAVILGTATCGDLGESMIKRALGIKDMSSWLPGHGGVLDRLDSILLSAPAALALYYLMTPMVTS